MEPLSKKMTRRFQTLVVFCLSVLITRFHFVDGAPAENEAQSSAGDSNLSIPGEERGGHFEGDIYLPQVLSSGIRNVALRWPNALVIYEIDPSFTTDELDVINGAMREISEKTCVQFSPRTRETDYVKIRRGGRGCWSEVGFQGKDQRINLEPQRSRSSGTCIHHGVVIHEILHTLGFYHEQSRTDRDEFVQIHQDNIRPDMFGPNFQKYDSDTVTDFNISYDYGSIMHYDPFAFAINRSIPTITPKIPGVKIGQREKLSEKDVQKIRRMYKIEPERVCLPFTMNTVVKMIKNVETRMQKQIDGELKTATHDFYRFLEIREQLPLPKSCSSIFSFPSETMNPLKHYKQTIYPHGNNKSLEVLCDFETDGGGWTIIQKRSSGPKYEFDQNWAAYEKGFGSLDTNFWLGLENIRALTKNGDQELKIELEDFIGEKRWAKYSSFSISDASDFYRLSVGGYSENSTVGNDMNHPSDSDGVHNGMQFSTREKDNDKYPGNCASIDSSGWWFNACGIVNLNGLYREKGETGNGIHWTLWKGYYYSLAKTEMKIRKRK